MLNNSLLLGLFAVLFLSACKEDSAPLNLAETDNIYANFHLVDFGEDYPYDYPYLEAQFTLDSQPGIESEDDIFLSLTSNERLLISQKPIQYENLTIEDKDLFLGVNNAVDEIFEVHNFYSSKSKSYSSNFGPYKIFESHAWYATSIYSDRTKPYFVSMLRKRLTSAFDSQVLLPKHFDLELSNTQESYSRTQNSIVLTWNRIEQDIEVHLDLEFDCSDQSYFAKSYLIGEDSGQLTIDPIFFEGVKGACSTKISLRKSRSGQLSPNYAGGKIMGHQIRSITLLTTD